MNKGHLMAWIGFGLSLLSLIMAFFLNVPLLFILLGVICAILSIADIVRSGISIPSIIALVITVFLIVMSGLAWYNNVQAIKKANEEMQRTEEQIQEIEEEYQEYLKDYGVGDDY